MDVMSSKAAEGGKMIQTIDVKLDDGAFLPERAHEADAGYDIMTPKDFDIPAGGCAIINTGVHVMIPEGYVGFLKSKSGLNVKYNVSGEGVIDASYTGSIVVKLYSHNGIMKRFHKGDKVIQLVILPIITPELRVVDDLPETDRGSNGFGSTGK